MLNWLKYLSKARYLHAAAGIFILVVGVCGVALVLHQVQRHQVSTIHATLALVGAILIGAWGLALTATYLRP